MIVFLAGVMAALLVVAIVFKPPGPTAGAVVTNRFVPI